MSATFHCVTAKLPGAEPSGHVDMVCRVADESSTSRVVSPEWNLAFGAITYEINKQASDYVEITAAPFSVQQRI